MRPPLRTHQRSLVLVIGPTKKIENYNVKTGRSLSTRYHMRMAHPSSTSEPIKREMAVPLGTRDYTPRQMAVRDRMMDAIRGVFRKHGGVAIDTPVVEYRDILMNKYGEGDRLIYDVIDEGASRPIALRYDLTVPFARYMAMHKSGNIKRFHIGKVYRRDNPEVSKGRYREFYQCDFDISGRFDAMLPETECLAVLCDCLEAVDAGPFVVRLNHRGLLESAFRRAGVPAKDIQAVASAVDKLDKRSWESVRAELVDLKGIPSDVADRLGRLVSLQGEPRETLARLRSLLNSDEERIALDDLEKLFGYLEAVGVLARVRLDMSLARGLEYYTGVIYEAVLLGDTSLGSVAAGGRYDGLIKDQPTVGVSIGFERLFDWLEQREASAKARPSSTQVLVASIGDGMVQRRLELAALLWRHGIHTETMLYEDLKLAQQRTYALEEQIPLLVFQGEDEARAGTVCVRRLAAREQETVRIDELVGKLHEFGA